VTTDQRCREPVLVTPQSLARSRAQHEVTGGGHSFGSRSEVCAQGGHGLQGGRANGCLQVLLVVGVDDRQGRGLHAVIVVFALGAAAPALLPRRGVTGLSAGNQAHRCSNPMTPTAESPTLLHCCALRRRMMAQASCERCVQGLSCPSSSASGAIRGSIHILDLPWLDLRAGAQSYNNLSSSTCNKLNRKCAMITVTKLPRRT
jgi:hypothetical protein